MKISPWWIVVLALSVGACGPVTESTGKADHRALAPSGTLRVAVVVGTSAAPESVIADKASGQLRGVPVELGLEFARQLGVPAQFLTYRSFSAVANAAPLAQWDVAFMPVAPEHERSVDFGTVYFSAEDTYLVPAGSPIQRLADVDRNDVRVLVQERSSQAAALGKSLKAASLLFRPGNPEALFALVRAGKADALASSRPVLSALAAKYRGARVLDGGFASVAVAIAVPKGRAGALDHVRDYLERALAAGQVRRAFDNAGLYALPVATPEK
jgi:polar amino acid transport system substrate-binding protein